MEKIMIKLRIVFLDCKRKSFLFIKKYWQVMIRMSESGIIKRAKENISTAACPTFSGKKSLQIKLWSKLPVLYPIIEPTL
jgi:hypothetical protein